MRLVKHFTFVSVSAKTRLTSISTPQNRSKGVSNPAWFKTVLHFFRALQYGATMQVLITQDFRSRSVEPLNTPMCNMAASAVEPCRNLGLVQKGLF